MLQWLRKDILVGHQIRRKQHFHARDARAEMAHLAICVREAGCLGFLRIRLASMLVLVVSEVLRCEPTFMAAIPKRCCPGELHRQHDHQQDDEEASHVMECSEHNKFWHSLEADRRKPTL